MNCSLVPSQVGECHSHLCLESLLELGRLRFVAVAIPGSAGLFSSILQWAQNKAGTNRVRINKFVRDSLDAFGRLATSLCHRPTCLAEIVLQEPTMLGATDAAKPGMGGVFFDSEGQAFVWRHTLPSWKQASSTESILKA